MSYIIPSLMSLKRLVPALRIGLQCEAQQVYMLVCPQANEQAGAWLEFNRYLCCLTLHPLINGWARQERGLAVRKHVWDLKAWDLGAEERKSSGLEKWQSSITRDESSSTYIFRDILTCLCDSVGQWTVPEVATKRDHWCVTKLIINK